MGMAKKREVAREVFELEGDQVVVHAGGSEWVVAGTKKAGEVMLRGREGLYARYCEVGDYDWDVASQEMAVHDAQRGRIFHDIRWARRQPADQELRSVVEQMQRAVQSAVSGR